MTAGRFAVGTILVGIGVLFVLDAFDSLDAGAVIADWWPAALVVLGAAQILLEMRVSVVSALLIGVGAFALVGTTGLLEGRVWSVAWPVAGDRSFSSTISTSILTLASRSSV